MNHLFILECLYNEQYDLLDVYDRGFTMESALLSYQFLERRELIVPDPVDKNYYIISVDGKEFYESLLDRSHGVETKNTPKLRRTLLFEEWWNSYPSTGQWISEDGRKFLSARALRTGTKEENRKLYTKIINEGKYTHENMLEALKYEIEAKKKQSLSTNINNMNFMQGSITYLRQRTFEAFVELAKTSTSDDNISNYELA